MMLCDSNVWLALALSKHVHHAAARWSQTVTLLVDDRLMFRGEEPAGLDVRWKQFAARGTASPKLWMAYLAAYALAGGHRLVTTDTAFRQFRGLDLVVVGNDAASAA
jgi:uncharacterized protein